MDSQRKKHTRPKDEKSKRPVDKEDLNKVVLKKSFDIRLKYTKEMVRSIIVDDVIPEVITIAESRKRPIGPQDDNYMEKETNLRTAQPHNNVDEDDDCDLMAECSASTAMYLRKNIDHELFTDRRVTDDDDDDFANDFVTGVLSNIASEENKDYMKDPGKFSEMLYEGTDEDANDDDENDDFAGDFVLNVLSSIASEIADQSNIDAQNTTKISDDNTHCEDNENDDDDDDDDDDLAGEIVTSILSVIASETQNRVTGTKITAESNQKVDEVEEAIVSLVMPKTSDNKAQGSDKAIPTEQPQTNHVNEEEVKATEDSVERSCEAFTTSIENDKANTKGAHSIVETTAFVMPQTQANEVKGKIGYCEADKNIVATPNLQPLGDNTDEEKRKPVKNEGKLEEEGIKNGQLAEKCIVAAVMLQPLGGDGKGEKETLNKNERKFDGESTKNDYLSNVQADKNIVATANLQSLVEDEGKKEKQNKNERKFDGEGTRNDYLSNGREQNVDAGKSQTASDSDHNIKATEKKAKKSLGRRVMGWFRKTFQRKRGSGSRGYSLFCCVKDNRVHPDDDAD